MRVEEIKETKEFYWGSLIVLVVLWISTIVFMRLQLGGVIPKIFIWVFSSVLFGYYSNYKGVIKRGKSFDSMVCIYAVNIISSLSYIACLAFLFGRYVMQMIR
ncbi:MAG: hypothetical protein IJ326_12190 [Lachnospiraceae bacterium]|nr:hypothetical protein [Lachnospiraceae bacterium]